jgi:hypothetical protein
MLMRSRARGALTLAALSAIGMMMLLPGATIANAGAINPKPSANVEVSGQQVRIQVSGNVAKVGSPGAPGSRRPARNLTVSVPLPCWMAQELTGKAYYEYVRSGQMARDNLRFGDNNTPVPGFEKFKDDDLGHWHTASCAFANWPDQNDIPGFLKFVDQFLVTHPEVYVPANQTPPTGQVPSQLLRGVAINSLTLPDPLLDWNPQRAGNQGTLVNLDTWFWLDSSPPTLTVTATAGGNQASVTLTFAGMDITAPHEVPLHCASPGTPYTPAARETNCALAFSGASSALGAQTTPVTVQTTWTGTWAVNGVDQGPISPQPAPITAIANIRVDEVQTLVTGVR